MSALSTFKVLELSESVAGEYCGKLLSDFGAQVIKIERPGCGSPTRRLGPFGARRDAGENSGLFAYLNTNKHSVALDLSSASGVETLGQAAAIASMSSSTIMPDGWLKRIGLDPATFRRNSSAARRCVRITAYGQSPPEDRRACRRSQRVPQQRLGISHAERGG